MTIKTRDRLNRSCYFMCPIFLNLLKIRYLILISLFLSVVSGCQYQYYYQEGQFVRRDREGLKFSQDKTWEFFFKTTYFYPVRDWFDLRYQWGRITGNHLPARNLTETGDVADSSFYTNRAIGGIDPSIIARGPNLGPEPAGPYRIIKLKTSGGSSGFIGEDANGYKYLIKMDDSAYPELGSTAEIIASRIYWALGYFVPETYLITVGGTGDERFESKRAIASRFVTGDILGSYKYDWLRDRREFRALKLSAMWLNDVDRSDNNNLAAASDDFIRFYILDFNGALGSWQGRPKDSWQGYRYRWDVEKQLLLIVTLGIGRFCEAKPYPAIESNSLGYLRLEFDPQRWCGEKPNMAFDRMTDEDAAWMAGKIALFSSEQLQVIITQAKLSNPNDAQILLETLLARREVILERYLKR